MELFMKVFIVFGIFLVPFVLSMLIGYLKWRFEKPIREITDTAEKDFVQKNRFIGIPGLLGGLLIIFVIAVLNEIGAYRIWAMCFGLGVILSGLGLWARKTWAFWLLVVLNIFGFAFLIGAWFLDTSANNQSPYIIGLAFYAGLFLRGFMRLYQQWGTFGKNPQ